MVLEEKTLLAARKGALCEHDTFKSEFKLSGLPSIAPSGIQETTTPCGRNWIC
jgi:hypothetical protein